MGGWTTECIATAVRRAEDARRVRMTSAGRLTFTDDVIGPKRNLGQDDVTNSSDPSEVTSPLNDIRRRGDKDYPGNSKVLVKNNVVIRIGSQL